MSRQHFFLAALVVTVASLLDLSAASSYATGPFAGAQYIQYNGTVTASIQNPAECMNQDFKLGPYVNAYLYVGKNPPWDPNPFFFELYHRESESNYSLFTSDKVYNLDFPSAAYACGADGANCEGFVFAQDYHAERKLDLTQASVSRVQRPAATDFGYGVDGDHTSFVGKSSDASRDEVDVDAYCPQINIDWTGWVWNASTNFTYSLSFFNTTAAASIVTYRNDSIMTIEFDGNRSSGSEDVELDTSDPDLPQFKFFGNQTIYFANMSGNWTAASTPISSSVGLASPTSATGTAPLSAPATATASGASATASGRAVHAFGSMDASNLLYIYGAMLGLLAVAIG